MKTHYLLYIICSSFSPCLTGVIHVLTRVHVVLEVLVHVLSIVCTAREIADVMQNVSFCNFMLVICR